MHKLTLSLMLSLLFFHPTGGAKKSDREYEGLKGDVRAVRIEEASFADKSGQWEESPREVQEILKYDAQGNLAEQITYRQGYARSKRVCSYDAEGNRNEEIIALVKPSQTESDSRKKLQPPSYKRTFKYDGEGRRTEESLYTSKGEMLEKNEYSYDRSGNLKERAIYNGYGNELLKCSIKLGESGEKTEEDCPRGAGNSRKSAFTYEFDSAGNWVKRIKTDHFYQNGVDVRQSRTATYRIIVYNSPQDEAATKSAIAKLEDVPTPREPLKPLVIRKSRGVIQGEAIKRVTPKYPPDVRGASGSVDVEVTIDEYGNVEKAVAVSGPQEFREVSVEAAKQWKFRPTFLSGVPVKVIGVITFSFSSR